MSKTLLIELTDGQIEQLADMLLAMEEGGACFAQVYGDGMRVRSFDRATAARVREAIGTATGAEGSHNNAEDAHIAAALAASKVRLN